MSNTITLGQLNRMQDRWVCLYPSRELTALERVHTKEGVYWRATFIRDGGQEPLYLWLLDDDWFPEISPQKK